MSGKASVWDYRFLIVLLVTLGCAFATSYFVVHNQNQSSSANHELPIGVIVGNGFSAGFGTLNFLILLDLAVLRKGDIGEINGYFGPIYLGLLGNFLFISITLWNWFAPHIM